MQSRKIIFAFPGMGKTTAARTTVGWYDLDFGIYRASLGVEPSKNSYLYPQFCRYLQYLVKDGWNVFVNEPGLIPWVKQTGAQIQMVLPEDPAALVARVEEREKRHPVSKAFVDALRDNVQKWLTDWEEIAKRYNVQVIKTIYVKEVLE